MTDSTQEVYKINIKAAVALESAMSEWRNTPQDERLTVKAIENIWDILQGVCSSHMYADLKESAHNNLLETLTTITSHAIELGDKATDMILDCYLHEGDWKKIVDCNAYIWAALVLTANPDNVETYYRRLLETKLREWTGLPCSLTASDVREEVSQVLFGPVWVSLFNEIVGKDFLTIYQALASNQPVFVFSPSETVNKPALLVPCDLTSE